MNNKPFAIIDGKPVVVEIEGELPEPGSEPIAVELPPNSGVEDAVLMGVAGAGMGLCLLAGGTMATTAMLVSVMTTGSGIILWIKVPGVIDQIPLVRSLIRVLPISAHRKQQLLKSSWKEFVTHHEALADILVSATAFLIFGTTVTGLIAAGMTSLMVSIVLRLRRRWLFIKKQVNELGADLQQHAHSMEGAPA